MNKRFLGMVFCALITIGGCATLQPETETGKKEGQPARAQSNVGNVIFIHPDGTSTARRK